MNSHAFDSSYLKLWITKRSFLFHLLCFLYVLMHMQHTHCSIWWRWWHLKVLFTASLYANITETITLTPAPLGGLVSVHLICQSYMFFSSVSHPRVSVVSAVGFVRDTKMSHWFWNRIFCLSESIEFLLTIVYSLSGSVSPSSYWYKSWK